MGNKEISEKNKKNCYKRKGRKADRKKEEREKMKKGGTKDTIELKRKKTCGMIKMCEKKMKQKTNYVKKKKNSGK